MIISKFFLTFIFVFSCYAYASFEKAEKIYGNGISSNQSKRLLIELIKGGYFFSALPWMKDYLTKRTEPLEDELEEALDLMLYHTGIKTFESLPDEILRRSNTGNIRYILAKRLLKKGKPEEAVKELSRVSYDHSSYPFFANLKAVIYSSIGDNRESRNQFLDCIRSSERELRKSKSAIVNKQLKLNKEYCLTGVARTYFGEKDYNKAELAYLDVQKESFVWPEILFEEAWSSYYLKNYNRTLGKLVSYKAPVFAYIFKPEIEVLKAMTYLRLCLYDDVKKIVDDFYKELLTPSRDLQSFLINRGKDFKYFYQLMSDFEDGKSSPNSLVDQILKSVSRDAAFIELKSSLVLAIAEYNQLQAKPSSALNVELLKNLKMVVDEYRSIIGAYVRSNLVSKYSELYEAFQNMSYLKLEVLSLKKEKLYEMDSLPQKKRGDFKYIERNDKQYFWTFNEEFWADELGDYVFALRSEC